ncbi:dynamin family protein [Haliangium sp.]|uniref:dynamin family protein n=1 Tax=Haliangium sp. TaxID=2663208 RepID=UPI003D0970C0
MREDAAEALLGLGQASLALGQTSAAIDDFRTALRTAAGDRGVLALSYRGLGMAYRRRGELDKAVRELRKAVAESPDDLLGRAALGEALLADPRISAEEARHHLVQAIDAAPTGGRDGIQARVIASLALGDIALQDQDGELARHHFERAVDLLSEPGHGDRHAGTNDGSSTGSSAGSGRRSSVEVDHAAHLLDARVGLGDAALLVGRPQEAYQHFVQALAGVHAGGAGARAARVHARIGDVQRRIRDLDAAIASYQRSLAIVQDREVLARALDTALDAHDVDVAVRLANDMLSLDPANPQAAVARGLGLARQGQHEAARATFRTVLDAGGAVEAHLALGRLELDLAIDAASTDGDSARLAGARAATEALDALRLDPTHRRARALLAEARARELAPAGLEAGENATGLYRLAGQLRDLAASRPELAELTGAVTRAAADFDQPLLVTVMGEFSSGKSTFVNAFIGHDVAPTGITPTTATINILKYGREPGGRISYRDGTIETLAWDQLFDALHGLDDARARSVDVVEILYPLAQLERVNIVDTPGLNSILPEHEQVARGFIGRADAVIWVFTAGQAGKASEREALGSIRDEGKRVLGVLNKMDQLAPAEVTQLVDYVRAELGELVEHIVPVSARAALEHRRQGEAAADGAGDSGADSVADRTDGNWTSLDAALETRFFAQARELKRDALDRRLADALARAQALVAPARTQALAAAEALRAEAEGLSAAAVAFLDRVVLEQRAGLQNATEALYRQAAREVLELVRPRELPFGSHSATPADRDYLLSLLDSGYEAALEHSRRQVSAALEQHKGRALAAISAAAAAVGTDALSDVGRSAENAVRLVEAQAFAPTRAYLRGYLRGGYVTEFFDRALPKLELVEDTVYHALMRDSPDLDAEISVRLAAAGTDAISAMADRLAHWAEVAEVLAYDVEIGLQRSVDELEERRRRWSSTGPVSRADEVADQSNDAALAAADEQSDEQSDKKAPASHESGE